MVESGGGGGGGVYYRLDFYEICSTLAIFGSSSYLTFMLK
jgi:hypothetical protein